jgi:hypothetical protein
MAHRLEERDRIDDEMVEACIRLEQAEFFLRRFREAELDQTENEWTRASATVASDALRAFGEAFYYFAGRAAKALRAVPGVDLDIDPVGVRNVRNHMVEHPETVHGLRVSWWQVDCAQGLVLQPGSSVGQQGWSDRGLYPNAEEFIEKLLPKIESAISQIQRATA